MKVFPDTKDLPITYANVNPTRCKLVHHQIGPYEILQIPRNAVELDLPNDMTINNTVNISRFKDDYKDDSKVPWRPPPPPVRTSRVTRWDVIQSIANHCPSFQGTSWRYKLKLEGWDKKDDTWEPEEIMAKANKMVTQYFKEIGRQPKAQRKTTRKA